MRPFLMGIGKNACNRLEGQMSRFMTVAIIVAVGLLGIRSGAQTPPADLYSKLFPHATGQNGLEEIVRAGDILANSPAVKEWEGAEKELTLTMKRRLLKDPQVAQTIMLYRQGLSKPIVFPTSDDEARFSSFAYLRRLARLISVEQYVLFAEGKTSQAIDNLSGCLRLSYAIQGEGLIHGLVGIAMDAIAMKTILLHKDQLSEVDCKKLLALSKEWLNAPGTSVHALTVEFEHILAGLEQTTKGQTDADRQQIRDFMTLRMKRIIEMQKKPLYEREAVPPILPNNTNAELVSTLLSTAISDQLLTKFAMDRAKVQELGVNAALMQYRWEHNKLPNSLTDLNVGKLTIDAVTGRQMNYKRLSDTNYELIVEGLIPPPVQNDQSN